MNRERRIVPLPVLSYRMYCALGELIAVLARREPELSIAQRKMLAQALRARSETAIVMGWSW